MLPCLGWAIVHMLVDRGRRACLAVSQRCLRRWHRRKAEQRRWWPAGAMAPLRRWWPAGAAPPPTTTLPLHPPFTTVLISHPCIVLMALPACPDQHDVGHMFPCAALSPLVFTMLRYVNIDIYLSASFICQPPRHISLPDTFQKAHMLMITIP